MSQFPLRFFFLIRNMSGFAMALSVFLVSCAPNIAHLQRHLDSRDFKAALEATSSKPELEIELAALIVERGVATAEQKGPLLDALYRAGSTGRRALKRLKQSSDEVISALAQVSLDCHARPDPESGRRYINHHRAEVRTRAVTCWRDSLDFETVEASLTDIVPRIRTVAVQRLIELKDRENTARLLRDVLRRDPDAIVRSAAARAGSRLGGDGLLLLKEVLKTDKSLGVRLAAIQGISDIGDRTARGVLTDLASGPMDELMIAAAAELSRLEDQLGRERLLSALKSKKPAMRETALLHLDRARLANRREMLVRALEDEAASVALQAVYLMRCDEQLSAKIQATLARIVATNGTRSREARDLLAALGDASSRRVVFDNLPRDDERDAMATLKRLKGVESLRDDIVPLLADPRASVRLTAALALLGRSEL